MAQEYEKISKVEEITSKTEKAEKVDILDRTSVQEGKFDEFLHKQDQSKLVSLPIDTQAKTRQSLMDEVRDLHTKVEQAGKASAESLAGHARDLIAQIEEVKGKLATSNVEIKGSVQTLLKNKLSHIDENLKIALDKAGVEYQNAPVASQNLTNPVDRFLGFLTNGQYQLQHLSAQLEHMSKSGEQLSPARMLAVQIKVGYITQELELFYNLLNKALESTKTIMNVQV